jgi:hypothetical protein
VRFLQLLFSVIVLVTVPIAAMILAYSYGTGDPFREAATQLARDVVDLYRSHVA